MAERGETYKTLTALVGTSGPNLFFKNSPMQFVFQKHGTCALRISDMIFEAKPFSEYKAELESNEKTLEAWCVIQR